MASHDLVSAPLALAVTAANSHRYPLIRGGGLILIGVGTGFLLAWIFPRWWIPLAVAGGVAGFTASGLSALLPSLGSPSVVQIIALVGALLVDALLKIGFGVWMLGFYPRSRSPERQPRSRSARTAASLMPGCLVAVSSVIG